MTINITGILNNKDKDGRGGRVVVAAAAVVKKKKKKVGREAEDATQGRSLRLNDVH